MDEPAAFVVELEVRVETTSKFQRRKEVEQIKVEYKSPLQLIKAE